VGQQVEHLHERGRGVEGREEAGQDVAAVEPSAAKPTPGSLAAAISAAVDSLVCWIATPWAIDDVRAQRVVLTGSAIGRRAGGR
jgi:hypothetical protein